MVTSTDLESESTLLNQPDLLDSMIAEQEQPVALIAGDDDIAVEENTEPLTKAGSHHAAPPLPEPAELISSGMNFLNGLFNTFSSPEATQKLVSSIVQNDPETGKTYLKIPVENEAVVGNALNLIGQLFSMVQKVK